MVQTDTCTVSTVFTLLSRVCTVKQLKRSQPLFTADVARKTQWCTAVQWADQHLQQQ